MAQARRIYLYVMAFAGLITLLFAVSGILALIVTTLTLPAARVISPGDVRQQASLYLAAIIIGLPVWLLHWLWGQRLAERSQEERQAAMRRLFLGAVFATTAVVALYGLHGLLSYLFTLPGATLAQQSMPRGISAGSRLLIYGAAWLGYWRIDRRPAADRDQFHDVAVYTVSGFSLGFLALGIESTLYELTRMFVVPSRLLLGGPERLSLTIWGDHAAWIAAGGAMWAAIWLYDEARGGRRPWRALYLYFVLIISGLAALGGATDGGYELLRLGFGYRPGANTWDFLENFLSVMITGAAIWAYHWAVLRRQAALALPGELTPPVEGPGIPWPRRPGLALTSLVGLAAVASAFTALLWVALDYIFNSTVTLSEPTWWRDRVSLSLAAGVIGLAIWLPAWLRLEHAASTWPSVERPARTRRLYLGFVTIAGALISLGFVVAMLWLVIRFILGEPVSASNLTNVFRFLAAAVVAVALALYHGMILRADFAGAPRERHRPHLIVIVGPGGEASLEGLRAAGAEVRVAGHLNGVPGPTTVRVSELVDAASRAESESQGEAELVILGESEAVMYTLAGKGSFR